MEISKLFASVGFRVDTKNLDTFESRLAGTQLKFVGFANSIDLVGKQASQAILPVNNLLRALDFKGKSAGIVPLANALERLEKAVKTIDMASFHSKVQNLTYALNEARPAINRNANAWERYAAAVTQAKMAVGGSWATGARAPRAPSSFAMGAGYGLGAGVGYSSSPHYTPQSRLLAPLVGSHLAYLGSSGVMAGVGAIYAAKMTLDRAQENVTAENFVKMASRDDAEFQQNKKWLWERSQYYGTDINANMEGFGKIYMNTEESLGREKSLKVIEDIMKYNTAMHTSREAQKFINKSLYQMAGTAQVNAQDYNQWEEHVAGGQKVAARALDILAEEKGGKFKDWRQYGTAKKAISEIQIEGKDLVPALTTAMAEASAKGLEVGRTGYQAEGARFQNNVTSFAREIADGGLFAAGKAFFQLLNSMMEVLREMMPLWSFLASAIGGFFTNLANGIQWIRIAVKDLMDFTHWIFTAGEETYALRGALTVLAVSALPMVLMAFRKFMTAVTMIMMKNPITAGLIIILTVLGWLYGQWKRQQEGLSNWFDFFSAILYLLKETFMVFVYTIKLYFFEFLNAMIDGFKALPSFFTSIFNQIKEKFSFIPDLIEKMKELIGLSNELDESDKKRREDNLKYGRPSPYVIPQFQPPTPAIPPTLQTPKKLSFEDAVVRVVDQSGRQLGTGSLSVAQAMSA